MVFPAALLLAELGGAALPLIKDLMSMGKKRTNPDTGEEEDDPDAPGIGSLALDVGSGLTGLGLVRGGLTAANAAAAGVKAAGGGGLKQVGAGFANLFKSAVAGAPEEEAAATTAARAAQPAMAQAPTAFSGMHPMLDATDGGVSAALQSQGTDSLLSKIAQARGAPHQPPNMGGVRDYVGPDTSRFQMVSSQPPGPPRLGYAGPPQPPTVAAPPQASPVMEPAPQIQAAPTISQPPQFSDPADTDVWQMLDRFTRNARKKGKA